MGYLRCEACGGKALSAASTCPRCAAPFNLHDARGARVALKRCSGCGIMHRRDTPCHWCGEVATRSWRSSAVLRSASGIAAIALVAAGSWVMREPAADAIARAYAMVSLPEGPGGVNAESSPTRSVAAAPSAGSLAASTAPAPSVMPDSMQLASVDGALVDNAVGGLDSVRWQPAVARTWVNVRRDASRGGDVVGVIKPSEKAMLGGVGRSGWRQVKSPDVTGWVDPRLFQADSLRTRG